MKFKVNCDRDKAEDTYEIEQEEKAANKYFNGKDLYYRPIISLRVSIDYVKGRNTIYVATPSSLHQFTEKMENGIFLADELLKKKMHTFEVDSAYMSP